MVLNSIKFIQRSVFMIYVGIDVAKNNHDCFITNSDGEVLFKSFASSNNRGSLKPYFTESNLHPMIYTK